MVLSILCSIKRQTLVCRSSYVFEHFVFALCGTMSTLGAYNESVFLAINILCNYLYNIECCFLEGGYAVESFVGALTLVEDPA